MILEIQMSIHSSTHLYRSTNQSSLQFTYVIEETSRMDTPIVNIMEHLIP